MGNNEYIELGTITLTPQQNHLIVQFSEVILDGTVEQAKDAYAIIFDREVESDMDLAIFKALCEQKLAEAKGEHYGIKGVFEGGKRNH